MRTKSQGGRGRSRRGAVATALLALMIILPASGAAATPHGKPTKPKKPPKTEVLQIWFEASGDYSGDAVGNIGGDCQEHQTENDHIEWDTLYSDVKVNVDGQNTQVTKSALVASTSDSSWESKQDGNGDDCGADVDCTSSHIAMGDPDDPKPQAFAVGMGTTTLQLKVEATGSDFIANDTQGNQACPTQVTGQGSLLFLALLNDHMGPQIPLYFTAHVNIPNATLRNLAVGKEAPPTQVKITDIPADTCETSVWTFCKDSLTWKGVVLIHRTA